METRDWFGLVLCSSIVQTGQILRSNISIQLFWAAFLWSLHRFYINRFYIPQEKNFYKTHKVDKS